MMCIRKGFGLVSSVFIFIGFLTADVLANGLENPGFETGVLNPLEDWSRVEPVADSVSVIGTDSFADGEVDPFRGEWMLRLGTPKKLNEKQERGANTVSQTFVATSNTLTFSFRLFSWEHRMDDLFRFDVCQLNKKNECVSRPYVITGLDGPPLTCANGTKLPCDIIIGDGKRGDLLDTHWVQVKVSGLEKDSKVRMEYSLIGGENNAHASWVYLDNSNTPPVAGYSFNTKGILDEANNHVDLVEGAHVFFGDESYDPDPGDSVVAWEWWISGSEYYDERVIIREQNPTFIFPDNIDKGEIVINLKVTDSFGASNTISSGGEFLKSDGISKKIASLGVNNNQALVRVLNQEVLAGGETELFARFIDPGFLDSHAATWNVDGEILGEVTESNGVPSASIGSVTAKYTASSISPASATLTISDQDGGTATETFSIEVLDQVKSREPNNDLASPPPALDSGWVYLSTLDSIGDVDIFEVVLPGTGTDKDLPAGSEVLVKLKDLPADYDLVVLSYLPTDTSTSTTPWLQTPWLQTPWLQTPWLQTPWLQTPWLQTPWLQTPWLQTPWLQTPWLQTPWLQTPWLQTPWLQTPWLQTSFVEQIPLSDLAQAELGGEEVGGSDLSISEIGLEPIPGLSVAGFSANRGIVNETVLVRTDLPGTKVYVAVIANNGAFSLDPYALQIEASKPLELDTLLGAECAGTTLIADPSDHVATRLRGSASLRTLIVTQKERFDAINGVGSWDLVAESLTNFATVEDFAVLNIDSSVYDAWDRNPCSIEEANNVSSYIRDKIVPLLEDTDSTIEYIVFIGGDNIIPFRRVPDETTISSEKLYAQDSQLKPGSPLFASMYQGNNLTDDYYVDNQPISWQGRELYVPKLPVSRLVETPSEIIATIDAYLVSAQIDLTSALVTGYDFFQDGAYLSVTNLKGIPTDTLISDYGDNEPWNVELLRCELLGEGDLCSSTAHGINNINAHFNHYGALSAAGYYSGSNDDFLSSQDIYNSGSALSGDLTYTIGCHSGLNVPDGSAYPSSALGAVDPNLDFPQAMSSQGSVYVGSTGFGLGDDVTVAGTEKLIALFSAELSTSSTVGEALVKAKQNYINGLSTITVYDEKSSIQTTMYGLPMYKLSNNSGIVSVAAVQAPQALQSETELSFDHVESTTEDGSYFTVNDNEEYQVTAWRPLQPKVLTPLGSTLDSPIHGVLITGGSYVDTDNFYPVISKPTQEWELDESTPAVCLDAFWPSSIATVNTLSLPGDIEQSLVLVPGQFRCTSQDAARVSGIQRNTTSLSYVLTGPATEDDSDFIPPIIKEVDLHHVNDSSIRVGVLASDNVGIDRIVLLVFQNGVIEPVEGNISSPDAGYFMLDDVPFSGTAHLLLQVVDSSGNVAYWSAKGTNAKVLEIDAEGETPVSIFSPTTLTGTLFNYNELVGENNELRDNDIFYRWEFGDGHTEFGQLVEDGIPVYDPSRVIIDTAGSGLYSFTVDHQYLYEAGIDGLTSILKITDSTGAIGVDDFTMRFCADPVGDVYGAGLYLDYITCGTANTGSEITIYLKTAAPVGANQFRLHLDLDNDGRADETLKYNDGSITGMKGLEVTVVDQLVTFTFDLPRKWNGASFQWYAETQEGVSGGAGQGFVDRMPDAGYFTHTIK